MGSDYNNLSSALILIEANYKTFARSLERISSFENI